jgi:hypothetical protein
MLGLGKDLCLAILDVSETGIRLLVKSAVTKGDEIEVELLGVNHRRPLKALAQVVWCIPGTFCLGAQFRRRLSYADFICLVSPVG